MSNTGDFVSRTMTIQNRLGLHARAASQFVQMANKFQSDIFVCKGSQEINGKSIMGILILAAGCGTDIEVKARGGDAHEALDSIEELINGGFGEEE